MTSHTPADDDRFIGSFGRRLTILVAVLLFTVNALSAFISYRALQRTLLEQAQSHALDVATELATLLATSTASAAQTLETLATHPAVTALVRAPAAGRAAAVDTLTRLAASRSQLVGLGLQLPGSGERIWVPGRAANAATGLDTWSTDTAAPYRGVGPVGAADSIIYFDAAARLPPPDGSAADSGWVLMRYRAATGQTGRLLAQFMGSDAVFLVGSFQPGAIWTDLERPVPAPNVHGSGAYEWDGSAYVGASIPVAGSAWQLWVGQGRAQVLAPTYSLLRQLSLLAALMIVLGSLAALALGRHVARPIARLTHAVEGISSGRYQERVPVQGRDEVARLAASFNVMAEQVDAATRNLEAQVAARTRELASTVRELNETQEQLVRREKLAMLGQLASGVGHELRNPLGVMTNAVFYLEATAPPGRDDVTEYLGIMRQQLALSEKIVADLLDFARVKPPQRQDVAIEPLVEQQLARLGALPDIHVARDFAPDLPPAHIDGVQIGQVLFNLFTNAVQAMDGRGRLTLSAAHENGNVRITVTDTGPGIAAADHDRVFEPLYTTRARGIGLGLALSRSLALANNGRIELTSEPGRGAAFTLVLPTTATVDS